MMSAHMLTKSPREITCTSHTSPAPDQDEAERVLFLMLSPTRRGQDQNFRRISKFHFVCPNTDSLREVMSVADSPPEENDQAKTGRTMPGRNGQDRPTPSARGSEWIDWRCLRQSPLMSSKCLCVFGHTRPRESVFGVGFKKCRILPMKKATQDASHRRAPNRFPALQMFASLQAWTSISSKGNRRGSGFSSRTQSLSRLFFQVDELQGQTQPFEYNHAIRGNCWAESGKVISRCC